MPSKGGVKALKLQIAQLTKTNSTLNKEVEKLQSRDEVQSIALASTKSKLENVQVELRHTHKIAELHRDEVAYLRANATAISTGHGSPTASMKDQPSSSDTETNVRISEFLVKVTNSQEMTAQILEKFINRSDVAVPATLACLERIAESHEKLANNTKHVDMDSMSSKFSQSQIHLTQHAPRARETGGYVVQRSWFNFGLDNFANIPIGFVANLTAREAGVALEQGSGILAWAIMTPIIVACFLAYFVAAYLARRKRALSRDATDCTNSCEACNVAARGRDNEAKNLLKVVVQ
ncbi:hypothetical protein EDC01DRAFT_754869 [Geopyxis carbonaria]|nr:hypothetical protein EDC01DRAFT_754869 [Geopyxis carbonaria]